MKFLAQFDFIFKRKVLKEAPDLLLILIIVVIPPALVAFYFWLFPLVQVLNIDFDRQPIEITRKDLGGPLFGVGRSKLADEINFLIEESIKNNIDESSSLIKGFRSSPRASFNLSVLNKLLLKIYSPRESAIASTTPFTLKCTPSYGDSISISEGEMRALASSTPRDNLLYSFKNFDCRIFEPSMIIYGLSEEMKFSLAGDLTIVLAPSTKSYWAIYLGSYVIFAFPAIAAYIKLLDEGRKVLLKFRAWLMSTVVDKFL